ncbi:MAG: Holliday junction branch migration protein RuvA [Candidatus Omnitrophota bacterium]
MLASLRGRLVRKSERKVFIDLAGCCYEVLVSKTVSSKLDCDIGKEISIVVYHYFHIDKSRAVPIIIGFLDEMEKDFFEVFTSVSGIGPRAALKAFDRPVALIARAIEEGDISFLVSLSGIGRQKAKQIVACLQGKVGRFALIREEKEIPLKSQENREIIEEARGILKRLQYSSKEIDSMIKRGLEKEPDIDSVEKLLNLIYRSIR